MQLQTRSDGDEMFLRIVPRAYTQGRQGRNRDMKKASFTDEKGRTRWTRNDEVAAVVKQLGEYLIIGGYPEEHAKHYGQLAHAISRWPVSIDQLFDAGELDRINGVGGVIPGYLTEIVKTGTTEKFNDDQYGPPPPRTVLELTAIDRLGPKTAHPVSGS